MTQKNIWNISVKELMEKYQVTEQGLTTARADVSYRITCNNGNQRTLINP